MTKGQWQNLKLGARVKTELPNLYGDGKVLYKGTVIRANSNWSQVLVRWDGDEAGNEIWYGRLGLELLDWKPCH